MSDAIIKNAVIRIGVEQGKADFKLNLDPIIKARKKELDLIARTTKATDAATKSQDRWTTGLRRAEQQLDPFQRGLAVLARQQEAATLATAGHTTAIAGVTSMFGRLRGVLATVGIVMGTGTAAVALLTLAYKGLMWSLDGANRKLEKNLKLQREVRAEEEKSIATQKARAQLAGASSPEASLMAAEQELASLEGGIEKNRKQAAIEMEKARAGAPEIEGVATGEGRGGRGVMNRRTPDVRGANERASELQKETNALIAKRVAVLQRIQQINAEIAADEKRATEEAEEKRAQELDDRVKIREAHRQSYELIRAQTREMAKARREAFSSSQQQFGRLSGLEQRQVARIMAKHGRGEDLNSAELGVLERGGAAFKPIVSEAFRKRGAGLGGILHGAGLDDTGKRIDEQVENIVKSGETMRDGIKDVFDSVNVALVGMAKQMGRLILTVEKNDSDQQQGAG